MICLHIIALFFMGVCSSSIKNRHGRFKPYKYSPQYSLSSAAALKFYPCKLGVIERPYTFKWCNMCGLAERRASSEYSLDHLIDTLEAKPLMICTGGKIYAINYPGGALCKTSKRIGGGHVIVGTDIEFLNCAKLYRSVSIAKSPIDHAKYIEVQYIEVPNFGFVLLPWHGREIVYFQDMQLIKPSSGSWNAVIELESGGVLGCFEHDRGRLYVLNDLGEVIKHFTMISEDYVNYGRVSVFRSSKLIYNCGNHKITILTNAGVRTGIYEFTGPRKLMKAAPR